MSLEMHEEEEDARTLSDSTLLRFTTKTEKREKRAVTSLTEHILSVTNENIYPVAQESQGQRLAWAIAEVHRQLPLCSAGL